jgi:hypothetical protein
VGLLEVEDELQVAAAELVLGEVVLALHEILQWLCLNYYYQNELFLGLIWV